MLDLTTDPAAAAALFERVSPDLGEPTAIWLDGAPEDGIVRWRIRSGAGAFRLKVSTAREGRARLRTGVAVLRALAAPGGAGLPVPEVRQYIEALPGLGEPVVVETRGLDGDAGREWERLARPARAAVVDRWAEALARLHALPLEAAGIDPPAGPGEDDVRHALVEEIARAVETPREQELLPRSFLKRVEVHLCRLVDRMPPGIEPAPCHGRPRLSTVLLARREFWGLRDFESAQASDPVSDVAVAALALGDPGVGLSARFLSAYAAAAGGEPAGLSNRLGLHLGLGLVRCVTAAAFDAPPEVVAAILDGLEAWLDEGTPAFR